MFKNCDNTELLNQIWAYYGCGSAPVGSYPIERYLQEAIRREIGNQLYHTEKTAQELLNDKWH